MNFETHVRGIERLQRVGVDSDSLATMTAFESAPPDSLTVPIELPVNKVYPLARCIVGWTGDFTKCHLLVTEYGVWPSSENRHLYMALRGSCGDNRLIYEAPFHSFEKHEKEALTSFVHLALEFGWGVLLVPEPLTCLLFHSHDGWIKIASDSKLDLAVEDLRNLGLLSRD